MLHIYIGGGSTLPSPDMLRDHGTPEPPVQHLVDYTLKTPILFQDRNTPLFIYLSLLTKIYPRTLDNNKNKHKQVNKSLRTQHI